MECIICTAEIDDPYGHNAEPLASGRCCEACNTTQVIPERIRRVLENGFGSKKSTQDE